MGWRDGLGHYTSWAGAILCDGNGEGRVTPGKWYCHRYASSTLLDAVDYSPACERDFQAFRLTRARPAISPGNGKCVVRTMFVVLLYTWFVGVCLLLLVGIGMSRQRARGKRQGATKPALGKVVPNPTDTARLHL